MQLKVKRALTFISLLGICGTLLLKSGFALKPEEAYILNPDSLQAGIRWEEHKIRASDSITLHAWKLLPVPGKDRKTTIILACGDSGNMSYFTLHGAALCLDGYTVVMFDYRGFGRSSWEYIDDEMLYYDFFADDLEAVTRWAETRAANPKTGIFAFSMGTIITQLALREAQVKVDFLVYEGFVLNPVSVKNRIFDKLKNRVKTPASAFDFEKKAAVIRLPTLIFAGTEDWVTTQADAVRYSKEAGNRKVQVFEGVHLKAFTVLTEKSYGDKSIAVLDAFLKGI